MRSALRTILAFAILTGRPLCVAQTTAAQTTPAQTAPATSTPTTPPEHIPVPQAGDPFFAPVALSATPQTFHQRFMDYAVITFGPRSLLTPTIGAAFTMLRPPASYPHDWKDGMGAFGRIYGSSLATRTSEQTARFLTAAILHEDFRYRPSTSTNVLARSFHAVAFTFVDKSDRGHNTLAASNFAGAAAGAFTANLYLPAGYNTTSRAETRLGLSFAGFAVRNLTREFAPDLLRGTHNLHLPFPRIPIPAWWTHRTP